MYKSFSSKWYKCEHLSDWYVREHGKQLFTSAVRDKFAKFRKQDAIKRHFRRLNRIKFLTKT